MLSCDVCDVLSRLVLSCDVVLLPLQNLFNWTQPVKTLPLYLIIVGVWLLTVFIPGRYIILVAGLSEFLYEFTPQPEVLPQKSRYVYMANL
jgi:hypothetical protein